MFHALRHLRNTRLTRWAVVLVGCLFGANGRVSAGTISIFDQTPTAALFSLTACEFVASDLCPDDVCDTDCCRLEASHSNPASPSDREPLNHRLLPAILLSLMLPVSSSGSGSSSSTTSSTHVDVLAVFNRATTLLQPTIVGSLYAPEEFDIPSAPSFELLRPPQVLANAS